MRAEPIWRAVIWGAAGAALLFLIGCTDPGEVDLDRCIALEKNQDWAAALRVCEEATRVSPTSNAGQLANGKAALLREKVAAKKAWEKLGGMTPNALPLGPDEDAHAAVAALQRLWPIASMVGSSNFRLCECVDTTMGYPAFKQCLDSTASKIAAAARLARSLPLPNGGCAQEIGQAVDDYVSLNEKWIAGFSTWVEANHVGLKRTMVSKSLTGACDHELNCDAQDRSGPSFESVNKIACTKTLFTCGPRDNVCWVNKVADRLGLGDGKLGNLTVRATGTSLP